MFIKYKERKEFHNFDKLSFRFYSLLFISFSAGANQLAWLLLCWRINKPKSQKTTARRQTQTFLDCKLFHFSPRFVLYFALVYFLSLFAFHFDKWRCRRRRRPCRVGVSAKCQPIKPTWLQRIQVTQMISFRTSLVNAI